MYYDIIESPIGLLTVSVDGDYLTGLHIQGDRFFSRIPTGWIHSPSHPQLQRVRSQLGEYFSGSRKTFDLPLRPAGTGFRQGVWRALLAIEPGVTTTYGHLARLIGRPLAARAVGSAVGRNPICIIIPCHRVLAADGGLGGFVAGLDRKQALLAFDKAVALS